MIASAHLVPRRHNKFSRLVEDWVLRRRSARADAGTALVAQGQDVGAASQRGGGGRGAGAVWGVGWGGWVEWRKHDVGGPKGLSRGLG